VELFAGIFGNQVVHEIQELAPAPATVMSGVHQPASHAQGCKERCSSVAFVFVSKAAQRPAEASRGRIGRSSPLSEISDAMELRFIAQKIGQLDLGERMCYYVRNTHI
jgi:hypothetical protein